MEPLSTPEVILQTLRQEILRGTLAPGTPLRQDAIAQTFGVSHVPVREAFRRLEAEGLAIFRPRRGAAVATLSASELEELNEMRVALECCALRTAIENMSASDIRNARDVLDEIDREPSRWGELNAKFHVAITRPANRPRLLSTILSLERNVERYLHHESRLLGNLRESQREHRRLLDLVRKRDSDAACELLSRHILEPGRIVVERLKAHRG